MAFVKVELYTFLLIFQYIASSHAFVENIGRKEKLVNNKIRADINDVVNQQVNKQLNIQLHVGDEESGFLTVQDMIIQLGDRYNKDEEERVRLPCNDVSSGGHRLNVVSKGTYVNMKGLQHVDCDKGCWEICWTRGSPAGTILFALNLPQTYSRNEVILPGGNLWLSFPVWTSEGLKYGQKAKQEVLDEIEFYDRKWNEELDEYEMTENPIMRMIHEWSAHFYATKCDDLYDYSLDTIPDDEHCHKLQEDLLLSSRGLIWKRDGNDDVLMGHAIVSPFCTDPSLSSFSSGVLKP